MASKCGKNKKVAHEAIAGYFLFVLILLFYVVVKGFVSREVLLEREADKENN